VGWFIGDKGYGRMVHSVFGVFFFKFGARVKEIQVHNIQEVRDSQLLMCMYRYWLSQHIVQISRSQL
jgi:hypothetical protein